MKIIVAIRVTNDEKRINSHSDLLSNHLFYFKMGRRAQLFISARECVNVLACPKPTNDLYESDFGLCMIYMTRLKLINILPSLLHKMYKCKCKCDTHTNLKQELLRYYKLNKIRPPSVSSDTTNGGHGKYRGAG